MRALLLVGTITLAFVAALFFVPPIRQSPEYHSFADQRTMFGVRNFLNVISNAPFLLVGILGLILVFRKGGSLFVDPSERWIYTVLFLGVVLTCFGSAYYHEEPTSARLVWDRLPMTLVFMSFFAGIISERISVKAGLAALPFLLVIGALSVIFWHLGEQAGGGDLRFYAAVQYYPLLAIPLLTLLFAPRYTRGSDIGLVILFYCVAKLFELLDERVFQLGGVVSGHTLKHLAAGAATYAILRMIRTRKPVSIGPSQI